MMHRIQKVKPIENSILLVEFQNGIEKTYNIKGLYSCFPQFEVFETDLFLFNSVKVDTVDTEYLGTTILISMLKKSGKTESKLER